LFSAPFNVVGRVEECHRGNYFEARPWRDPEIAPFSLDVVDAVAASTAARLRAVVVTGDRADIARLLDAAGADVRIIDI
jgi:hypothetical protein